MEFAQEEYFTLSEA